MDRAGTGIPLRPTASRGAQRLQLVADVRVPAERVHLRVVARPRRTAQGMWKSLANSVVVGLGATAIALVLGTMAAFAVQRYEFFGRNASVSLWCCRSRCPASSPASR